jgi:hypothetical protein
MLHFYNILKRLVFNDIAFMPPEWNDGMLGYWNNGQKRITSMFGLRMPFHVGAKAKNNNQDARTHDLDVSRQLLYALSCGLNEKFETCFTTHYHWFFA